MTLEILTIDTDPIAEIPAVSVAPGGHGTYHHAIPILTATVRGLPDGLDGLVAAADLQALDREDQPPVMRELIGHRVAEELATLGEAGVLPAPSRTGVLLAGDLFTVYALDRRGGFGDVEAVWRDFADRFRWVVGVAGNHDAFRGQGSFEGVFRRPNIHPLDGDLVEVDGLKIAGISGIIGDERKPWRVSTRRFRRTSKELLAEAPDIFLTHTSPSVPEVGHGDEIVRQCLERATAPVLSVCGHCHHEEALGRLGERVQVLNVEMRVVVMRREGG